MRITNNMVTDSLETQLQSLASQQANLQTEVGSGLAISQPSDNPAAVGQVLELQAQSSETAQYQTNASQALNVAQASYSGLNSMVQILDRATELGTLGGGGTSPDEMQSYASEVDQLVQQSVTVANSQLGGQYLYGGTATSTPPFTVTTDPTSGEITGVTYVGNSDQTEIPITATSNISPSTSGATNQGMADFINNLVSLRDALQNGDSSSLTGIQQNITTSEDTLTSAVAENGAIQGRIQSDQTQQQSSLTDIGQQISSLADTDLPTTIVSLSQTQLAYQAAMQTAATVMQLSLLNYIH